MSKSKNLKLDLYNFDDINKARRHVQNDEKLAKEDQKEKLRLLLRICGGFKSNDSKLQAQRVDQGYALTFDNILKIEQYFSYKI